MRYKLIACKVLNREFGELTAACKHTIDLTWLKQGLHNVPDFLRATVQENIDRIDEGNDPYTFVGETYGLSGLKGQIDAILLGYGLCSNGVVGLVSRKYPLVVPRAHDCISLFLGSKELYQKYFDEMSGAAFWYNPGWIENCFMPCEDTYNRQLAGYIEKYGEDNAEYLLDMEMGWYKQYAYTAYIAPPQGSAYPDYTDFTQKAAAFYGWKYREFQGDNSLMERMLAGDWDEDSFLVVPPGKTIVPSYDDAIIRVGEPEEAAEFLSKQGEAPVRMQSL